MYYVYVLYSEKDAQFYIGQTKNLSERIRRHQSGYVQSTRNRRPIRVVYSEKYEHRYEAMRREKFLKSGEGHKYINKMLWHANNSDSNPYIT